MAILKKPYELSLWKDVWNDTHQYFDEQKICVIGSNDMASQGRAFDLTLKRNVNGSKKLTFKMYKKYIDTITGETIHNPFVDILVSESKIKLNYNGRWFDFIIKNIVENSSTHLCTYQLEDAFVNELSKNGFNKILSTELENNMGSIKDLANDLLDETDWRVGPTSEKIVQTVEDALVYVTIPQDTTIYPLIDQDESDRTNGVKTGSAITLDEKILVLAFYTSCKNKPHRFQFIYQSDGYFDNDGKPSLSRDSERIINQENCQYYCEIDDPANYTVTQYNMSLPDGWSFSVPDQDELISTLYRGDRYGFTQQSKYIPEIDRYVYLYKKDDDDTVYYGYQYNQYTSATTVSDIITNSNFKDVAGWTGHTTERIVELDENGDVKIDENGNPIKKDGVKKALVESVYGYFNKTEEFVSLIDDLQNDNYKPDEHQYLPYLKFSFENNTNKKQIVLNSGPYDHRYSIKEMPEGSLWAIRCDNQKGESLIDNDKLNFLLAEYVYNTDTCYLCYTDTENFKAELVENEGVYETYTVDGVTYYFFKVTTNNYATETAFTKNSEVRLVITEKNADDVTSETIDETIYYIKNIELFRAHYTKEETPKLLIPNENHVGDIVEDIKDQIIFSEYRYFSKDAVKGITDEKDLELAHRSENLTYETYKPVYNNEAEKIRSVEEKESNYFNILQSLAETFECWLDIEVERDDTGKIIRRTEEDTEGPMGTLKKNIVFKNFVGQKNQASFRYGVNLKDIQRTYESKNIVTKLVVKTNANEHAANGFCTIQRAGANPTGENYLYDFGYYHNMGLLDPDTYLSIIQDSTDTDGEWKGPDCGIEDEINLKGYNIRISNLNKAIQEKNEKLIGLAQDITKVSTQKKTAEVMLEAAETGIMQVEADYEKVAKQHITAQLDAKLLERDDVKNLLVEYGTYMGEKSRQAVLVAEYTAQYVSLKNEYDRIKGEVDTLLEQKKALNTKFYNTYSRFIQEGTWVDEEYIDDDKYYNDAKSVLYNSCYPQVAYNINVLALSMLPGYELLDFDLGDQTNVVDPEFFGEQFQEEVVVTETTESLDDPTKNTIKVQNFKNQFQDLFQKITATVQQAQYSTGAYQKAVSLAYAEDQAKMEFLNGALSSAGATLAMAGQQSVEWGDSGLTVTDVNTPCNEIRMIGGAILLSKQDEQTGQKKWVSAITSDGISANLVTAGVINTGKIAIMNGNEQNFLWDANGINAFGEIDEKGVKQFVRFDKHGIYGISNPSIDGRSWVPESENSIDNNATFALTWEGLKVVGNNDVEANIGKQDGNIINITKKDSNGEVVSIFKVTNSGALNLSGIIHAEGGDIAGWMIDGNSLTKGDFGDNDSIYLSTAGITNTSSWFSNTTTTDKWMLGIGNKFGVTSGGDLYANGGKIGDWDIDETSLSNNKIKLYGQNNTLKPQENGELASPYAIRVGGTQEEPNIEESLHTESKEYSLKYFYGADKIELINLAGKTLTKYGAKIKFVRIDDYLGNLSEKVEHDYNPSSLVLQVEILNDKMYAIIKPKNWGGPSTEAHVTITIDFYYVTEATDIVGSDIDLDQMVKVRRQGHFYSYSTENIKLFQLDKNKSHNLGEAQIDFIEIDGARQDSTQWNLNPEIDGNFVIVNLDQAAGSGIDLSGKEVSYSITYKYWTKPSSFYLLQNGQLFAKNVDIQGKVSATHGKIGNIEVADTKTSLQKGKNLFKNSSTFDGWNTNNCDFTSKTDSLGNKIVQILQSYDKVHLFNPFSSVKLTPGYYTFSANVKKLNTNAKVYLVSYYAKSTLKGESDVLYTLLEDITLDLQPNTTKRIVQHYYVDKEIIAMIGFKSDTDNAVEVSSFSLEVGLIDEPNWCSDEYSNETLEQFDPVYSGRFDPVQGITFSVSGQSTPVLKIDANGVGLSGGGWDLNKNGLCAISTDNQVRTRLTKDGLSVFKDNKWVTVSWKTILDKCS